jgi:hypothetical protein
VSEDVYETTRHSQLPELSLSIIGRFYLRGKIELTTKADIPPSPPPASIDTTRLDFEAAERVDTVAGWDAFLTQHPTGFYSTLARERRNMVTTKGAAPQSTSAAIAPSGQSRPSTSPQQTIPNPLRQRVVLYDEDPSDPTGKQFVGSVVWRTEPIKATGKQKPDIAVRADIEIPDCKFKMTMSFRRNTDSSLPASHTVELSFLLAPDFAGGGIANVPGLLMKSDEKERGTPLAGLASANSGPRVWGFSRSAEPLAWARRWCSACLVQAREPRATQKRDFI